MFSIHGLESVQSDSDITGFVPAGEKAHLVSEVVIHPGLAKYLPHTHLVPLTSTGNTHTYSLQVRGYTVERFVEVVKAFATGDFTLGQRLIDEIAPPHSEAW